MRAADYLREHGIEALSLLVTASSVGWICAVARGLHDAVAGNPAEFCAIAGVCFGLGMLAGSTLLGRVHSGPSLSKLCAPLSERCRAMLLEAVENGEVMVFCPSDTDAAFLVGKGLLEAPSTVSPLLLTALHVPPARFAALSRRKSELLGDIPAGRRERLLERR